MSTPKWVVLHVQAKRNHTLDLEFADGKKGNFDFKPLLVKPMYAKLSNISYFLGAFVSCGSVAWDEEIDIAPEYLYENSITEALYSTHT